MSLVEYLQASYPAGAQQLEHERLGFKKQLAELTEQRDALLDVLKDVLVSMDGNPALRKIVREALLPWLGQDDEPDGAGYPDMDSAGGSDELNRAYGEKRGS